MKESEMRALCDKFDGLIRVLMSLEERLADLEDRVSENGG